MKNLKSVGLLLFVMLLSVSFISCNDDDDDPVVENNSEIVGSWKLSTITPQDPTVTIPGLAQIPALAPCYNQLVLKFAADYKVTASDCEILVQMMSTLGYLSLDAQTTWTTDADTLTIKNGSNIQSFKYDVTGNDLSIIVNTDPTGATTANIILLLKKQ